MYPRFKQDPNVIVTDEILIDDISSARILLSISCPEVNLVFMLILPTNKVYWMLAVLNIKDAYVTCIQLNQENIHTIMSRSILKLNRLSK